MSASQTSLAGRAHGDGDGDCDSTASSATTRHHRRRSSAIAENAGDGADGTHPSVPSTKTSTSRRSRARRSRRSSGGHGTDDAAAAAALLDAARLTLCCDGVTVSHRQRDVIDEVSCLCRGGRVTAIVNGCGTHSALALLAAMAGRVESSAGSTVLNGIPVSATTCQAQISFLEASRGNGGSGSGDGSVAAEKGDGRGRDGGVAAAASGLLGELTVRENLQYASALRVANSAQAYSVDEVVQQLLLGPHESTKVKSCSLYVHRRVALGRELLLNPSVLLLDEPLEGLATHESQQYLTILSKLAAPSAADAEARRLMREAMNATAAEATAPAEEGSSHTTNAAAVSASAQNTSIYTPRHSRLHRGAAAAAAAHVPDPLGVPTPPPLLTEARPPAVTAALRAAETQRVVVLSMVQPRWALLQYVHDVVLLQRARCVVTGSVQDMLAVKLPRSVLRAGMAASAEDGGGGGGGAGQADELDGTVISAGAAAAPSPRQDPLTAEPADSYDAVAALIQRQRLGEHIVHGLYRLAASTATAGADERERGATADPEFCSIISVADLCDPPSASRSGAPAATTTTAAAAAATAGAEVPPSTVVDADGPLPSPLQQLYAHRQARARAAVTDYMEACAAGLTNLPVASHQPPSSVVQLLHLFRFGFLELRQNLAWNLCALACGLALAAVLAALYGHQGNQSGMQNRVGIVFFLVSCVVLQSVLSLDALRREYAVFHRYSAAGYYSAWTYLVHRAVTTALWRFGLAAFVALVVFVLSNFGDPWREYRSIFELSVILAVASYCSQAGVWFLCAWWPSDRVGRLIVFAFYTLNIILAGLVLNLQTLPQAVQVISFASVMRLAYESCILTQFIGKSFGCNRGSNDDKAAGGSATAVRVWLTAPPPPLSIGVEGHSVGPAWRGRPSAAGAAAAAAAAASTVTAPCYTGVEYAEFLGFLPSRRWSNVGALFGISALLLVGSWFLMALYRPRRRMKMPV